MTTTAERLMQMAAEADTKADEMLALASAQAQTLDAHLMGNTGDETRRTIRDLTERAYFRRGQASGFRQSAYFAAVLEGTHAND